MPVLFNTPRQFIAHARQVSAGSACCLIELDRDYLGFFLGRYGRLQLDAATRATAQTIAEHLSDMPGASQIGIAASVDEMRICAPGKQTDALVAALIAARHTVGAATSTWFDTAPVPFGFTGAVIEYICADAFDTWINDWRSMSAIAQQALEHAKGTLEQRGSIVRASVAMLDLPYGELAGRIWHAALASRDMVVPLSLPTFLNLVTHHPTGMVLAVRPLFGGAAFARHTRQLLAGTTTLPNKMLAGKLGFLNRLFAEHVTPDVLLEQVFATMLRFLPFEVQADARVCRVESTMLIVCPVDTISPALIGNWLRAAGGALEPLLRDDLPITHIQVALLSPDPRTVTYAADLGVHIYKVLPACVIDDGLVLLSDLRGAQASLATLVDHYALKRTRRFMAQEKTS